jgi:hypothetical protein
MLELALGEIERGEKEQKRFGGERRIWGFRATNYRKLRKMVLSTSKRNIFTLCFFEKSQFFWKFPLKWCGSRERLTWMFISGWGVHGDRCRACTPIPVQWRGWTLVLDGKSEGGIISIFSYTTGTKFDKKVKLRGQKIKVVKHRGQICI